MAGRKKIIAKNQKELDEIPKDFDGIVVIEVKRLHHPVQLLVPDPKFKEIRVCGRANVEVHKRQHAECFDSSMCFAYEHAEVVLHDRSRGEFYDQSKGILRDSSKGYVGDEGASIRKVHQRKKKKS